MKISKEAARKFLVRHQHLDAHNHLSGKEGILEYFDKVGCVQFDPLNVVGRNADLVLQSRISNYKTEMLESLLYEERSLVDGWDKVMSIYPTKDFAYFHLVREQRGKEAIAALEYRKSAHALDYIDFVMDALAKNGPMQPKQIGKDRAGNSSWGHRNIYNATMDYLFHIGKLGVSKKINVNKVYDLIENLIPADIVQSPVIFETKHDFFKWYVYRRIASVGMLWNKNGGGWYGTLIPDKKTRQLILDGLIDEGLVIAIEVEGVADKFYVRKVDFSLEFDERPKTVKIIAPLDNLIWDRAMTKKIFDFEYTWEVYVPSAKRKYGYYVLPVLFGDRFIARFEPENSTDYLCIKNWWWEQDTVITDELIELVMQSMEQFSEFLKKEHGVHQSLKQEIIFPRRARYKISVST